MTDSDKDFHARIRVLEEWKAETRELLHSMNAKLDGMTATLNRMGEIRHCPMPGACIELKKEVDEMRKEHAAMMQRIDERVARLERVQTFAAGAIAAVSVLWAVLKVVVPWVIR